MVSTNKLQCLSQASHSSLVQYLQAKFEPTRVEHLGVSSHRERNARNKSSSLFGLFVSDELKKVLFDCQQASVSWNFLYYVAL